jgi:hypothetical protein
MNNRKLNILFIFLAVISIIVWAIDRSGIYQMDIVAFILFTILCLFLVFAVRDSKWKITGVIIYWVLFGDTQMI